MNHNLMVNGSLNSTPSISYHTKAYVGDLARRNFVVLAYGWICVLWFSYDWSVTS